MENKSHVWKHQPDYCYSNCLKERRLWDVIALLFVIPLPDPCRVDQPVLKLNYQNPAKFGKHAMPPNWVLYISIVIVRSVYYVILYVHATSMALETKPPTNFPTDFFPESVEPEESVPRRESRSRLTGKTCGSLSVPRPFQKKNTYRKLHAHATFAR
jgi:hypothetical protein